MAHEYVSTANQQHLYCTMKRKYRSVKAGVMSAKANANGCAGVKQGPQTEMVIKVLVNLRYAA
ncbi:hypothetical protein D3H65_10600 [Paraflavitalea soli]|uniref:Uncharacterized protein n=1 Tax=Paraflavitalea soli TaxID=2315862 RepID=A0A3B7MJN8_9BACT|nr:hypothetical protein D3H65_10600 [Paraflavitalea soli]